MRDSLVLNRYPKILAYFYVKPLTNGRSCLKVEVAIEKEG